MAGLVMQVMVPGSDVGSGVEISGGTFVFLPEEACLLPRLPVAGISQYVRKHSLNLTSILSDEIEILPSAKRLR